MNNDDVMMGPTVVDGNVNVTPMETDDGIVRLVVSVRPIKFRFII